MNTALRIGFFILFASMSLLCFAGNTDPSCCKEMGGIQYCDSSAGRFVCKNGYYSSCYCTRHAIMDFQKLQGCCLWQGGVMNNNELGQVICNNGQVAEICAFQFPATNYATWP